MNKIELRRIFEATMDELFDISLESLSRESELYCNIKSSYKQGDIKSLQNLYRYIKKEDYSYELKLICKIRLGIRKRNFDIETWIKETELIKDDSIWKGEIFFSIGYALDSSKDYYSAHKTYIKAYKLLLSKKCPNKALLSLHNAIAVQGNRFPDKRQFTDYHSLLKKAKKQNCQKVIGLANLNLSIEYQKTGATHPALERIEQAIIAFEHEIDSNQYYLALAQKCDLLIDIQKFQETTKVIQLMKASNHEFTKGAIYNLEQRMEKEKGAIAPPETTSTNIIFSPSFTQRREKMKKNQKQIKLGKLESKLIDFLGSGPKDKISIIKHLYGEQLDYYSLEGRFKSLLVRLRKKIAYQINYFDGQYSIDGELSELKKVKIS